MQACKQNVGIFIGMKQSTRPFYLGIDCGGSGSRVMVIDNSGEVIFEGRSGPANVATTPRPYLAMSLKRALEGAPNPDYVCGCFAGLVSDEYGVTIKKMLEEFLPGAKVKVIPDFHAALAASLDSEAICVLSGTGSLVCSSENSIVCKTGGGGALIGDEGSTYSIGSKVLQKYVRSKPDEVTQNLHDSIVSIFGVADPREVVARVYRDLTPTARIAMLVPCVARDWDAGEPYAKQIVQEEMSLLALLAKKHIEEYRSKSTEHKLYLAGGLWNISELFKEVFENELRSLMPNMKLTVTKIKHLPIFGAALLAKEMENEYRKS